MNLSKSSFALSSTYLYIIPLFEIFIVMVSPIIRRAAIKNMMASSILKVVPICPNNSTIFLSAIGSDIAPAK